MADGTAYKRGERRWEIRTSDVPLSTIRRAWHDPQYEIKLATLHKIAKTLGVRTIDLIEDVDD